MKMASLSYLPWRTDAAGANRMLMRKKKTGTDTGLPVRFEKRVVRNRERLIAGQLHCLSGIPSGIPKEKTPKVGGLLK